MQRLVNYELGLMHKLISRKSRGVQPWGEVTNVYVEGANLDLGAKYLRANRVDNAYVDIVKIGVGCRNNLKRQASSSGIWE